MMRSLYTGVSGLTNHQTRMDVLSNNIANVNTIGYKGSRTVFSSALSQTMQGATSPRADIGGINAKQIGLGVKTSSIDILFTKTSFQTTNVNTDLAINNNGFFIVNQGNQSYYTRAGNFYFDENGNFLTNEGLKVQGWMADSNGNINTAAPLEAIIIPVTATMPPKISTSMDYKATNLSADSALGDAESTSVDLVDSQGYNHRTSTNFTKIDANTWIASTTVTGAAAGSVQNNIKIVTFDEYGKFASVSDVDPTTMGTVDTSTIPATINTDVTNGTTPAITLDEACTTVGETVNYSLSFIDADGNARALGVKATCTAAATATTDAEWKLDIIENSRIVGSTNVTSAGATSFPALTLTDGSTFQFDAAVTAEVGAATASNLQTAAAAAVPTNNPLTFSPDGGPAVPMSVTAIYDQLTQYAGSSTKASMYTDGYVAGDLVDKNIDAAGIIVGTYSNGQMLNLGQVGMAIFNNQQGLERAGSTLFTKSNNSGDPIIGTAGSGGIGTLQAGSLEMANVDLAEEFTNMIVTQRGYQSNSRVITTSDELLQELLNLKR